MRKATWVTAIVAPSLVMVSCLFSGEPSSAVVERVIDGDTVELSDESRVRLIGIDTPERGVCGYEEATARLVELIEGQPVTLHTGARDDVDRYDRLLRYIEVEGTDAGRVMIDEGYAIARYDSRDGYGEHDREKEYVAADAASPAAVPC